MNQYIIARQAVYWKFPTSVERLAYSANVRELTKIAWQVADDTLWMLTGAPSTWLQIHTGNSVDYITQVADGAIGGHRVVKPTTSGKVGYADKDTAGHLNTVLGISLNAAADGDDVNIQYDGKITEGSWAWTVNVPIFCGAAGVLTATAPTSGAVIQVGTSLSPTSILVNVRQPITLS